MNVSKELYHGPLALSIWLIKDIRFGGQRSNLWFENIYFEICRISKSHLGDCIPFCVSEVLDSAQWAQI